MKKQLLAMSLLSITLPALALDTYYCSQNNGYINPGMSDTEVIAACGQPIAKQTSNAPVMQKIPITQLIYNRKEASSSFYGPWNLPIGNMNHTVSLPLNTGPSSGGVQFEIDIDTTNNKIVNLSINGGKTNAVSLCGGFNLAIGDYADNVAHACGQPSMMNQSFIEVPVEGASKPEVWIYQADQYQPVVSLTFIDGKLQSIN